MRRSLRALAVLTLGLSISAPVSAQVTASDLNGLGVAAGFTTYADFSGAFDATGSLSVSPGILNMSFFGSTLFVESTTLEYLAFTRGSSNIGFSGAFSWAFWGFAPDFSTAPVPVFSDEIGTTGLFQTVEFDFQGSDPYNPDFGYSNEAGLDLNMVLVDLPPPCTDDCQAVPEPSTYLLLLSGVLGLGLARSRRRGMTG